MAYKYSKWVSKMSWVSVKFVKIFERANWPVLISEFESVIMWVVNANSKIWEVKLPRNPSNLIKIKNEIKKIRSRSLRSRESAVLLQAVSESVANYCISSCVWESSSRISRVVYFASWDLWNFFFYIFFSRNYTHTGSLRSVVLAHSNLNSRDRFSEKNKKRNSKIVRSWDLSPKTPKPKIKYSKNPKTQPQNPKLNPKTQWNPKTQPQNPINQLDWTQKPMKPKAVSPKSRWLNEKPIDHAVWNPDF